MTVADSSVLRIGFDDPFRPLAWSGDRRPEGPLLEMAAAVLEAAGLAFTFVPLALQHSLVALANGDVDALAYKAVVPDRGAALLFTRPLMTTGAALFQLANSAAPPGILATPAKGPLVDLLTRMFPGAGRVLTEDYSEALNAVIEGRAHAAALNVHVGWYFAEASHPGRFAFPKTLLAKLDLAMAVGKRCGVEVRDRLDVCISELQVCGKLREILERSGVPLVGDA